MKHQHKCCTLILWSKHFLSIKVQCCSLFSDSKYFENRFYSWYSPGWLNTLYEGRRAVRSSGKGRKGRFGRFRRLPSMEPLKYKVQQKKSFKYQSETHMILQTSVKEFLRQEPEFLKQNENFVLSIETRSRNAMSSPDRGSLRDDVLLSIQQAPTFWDFEHSCLSI